MELNLPMIGFSAPAPGNQLVLEPMELRHKETVLPMVLEFYSSDAVDHPVPPRIVEQTFLDAVDPKNTLLCGYLLKKGGLVLGFFYLTFFYACEVGGLCVMIEEIFIKKEFQGKGLGKQAMSWIHQAYSNAKRFRLEVAENNQGAKKLYASLGYEDLSYGQMVRDL